MKSVWAAMIVLLAACGAGDETHEHEDHYVDHDLGVIRQGLTVGGAGGCDTSIVAGLTVQLVKELNCIAPNTMVDFRGPGISISNAVQPYLAPTASTAMKSAVSAAGTNITLSSAYRSVAQQYLLKKWEQAGQCGIQAAATPGKSNHQSGRAIDVPSYSFWISKLQAKGWRWFGSGDVVHFDYNGAADLGSKSVLAFQRLWNKNNSNKLAEDGAWGPSTENAMKASPTTGFAVSGCTVTPPPPPTSTTGTLKGKVYEVNPANAGDLSKVLAGATVKVGGKTLTTGADGLYTVDLPVGTYTVVATVGGYAQAQLSRQVTASNTVWGSVGLSKVGTADTVAPELMLTSPSNASSLDQAQVTLVGTASDDQGTVKSLTVSLNGGTPQPVALAAGAFSQMVKLSPGLNALSFEASDAAGNSAKLDVKLTFRAGVAGVVTTGNSENAMPLSGAQLQLLSAAGMTVASTQTDGSGDYAFDVAPGTYTLVAQASGFAEYRAEVVVDDENRSIWSFTLDAQQKPGVHFVYPNEGDVVFAEKLNVTVRVDGFVAAKVTVNSVEAQNEGAGQWAAVVPLELGTNVLHAVAVRPNGTLETMDVTVTRSRSLGEGGGADEMKVRGGCSAAPAGFGAVVALLSLLGRRRSRR